MAGNFVPAQQLYRSRRQPSGGEFAVDLANERVGSSDLLVTREHQRREALPDARTLPQPEQRGNTDVERSWQRPQIVDLTLSGQGNLQLTNTPLRPRSLETPKRALGIGPEPHRRVYNDMVEMTIAIEIHGQQMGVLVPSQRPSRCVLANQLRAVDTFFATHAGNERPVQQLGLW